MIISSIIKNKKGEYDVIIDDKKITLSEDTIIKYRLYKNKELETFDDILVYDQQRNAYNKALSYALKYNKNSNEVKKYLLDKEYNYKVVINVIEELIENKIINDLNLAVSIANYLARNGNGPLMIKEKLKLKLFSNDTIMKTIELINPDDYQLGKEKLIIKYEKKYQNDDIRDLKIKKQLYNHGYYNE